MFLRKRTETTTTATNLPPSPYVFPPSGKYIGNDGKWSTFHINIGDTGKGHGQNFQVVPFTSSPITLVPLQSDWCNDDCAAKRGVEVFEGKQPSGYKTESSQAFKEYGTYDLPVNTLPTWTGSKLSGYWALDNVGLGTSSEKSPILQQQYVVGYTAKDFYLGSFGLTIGDISAGSESRPPFLQNFAAFQQIPSRSYGYTAGAFYSEWLLLYLRYICRGQELLDGFQRSSLSSSL